DRPRARSRAAAARAVDPSRPRAQLIQWRVRAYERSAVQSEAVSAAAPADLDRWQLTRDPGAGPRGGRRLGAAQRRRRPTRTVRGAGAPGLAGAPDDDCRRAEPPGRRLARALSAATRRTE